MAISDVGLDRRSPRLLAFAWTVLGALAVAGSTLLTRNGDVGAVLLLIAAAPVVLMLLRVPWTVPGLVALGIVVLLVVPARNRFAALNSLGTPASLTGVLAFSVWAYGRFFGRRWLARGPQPLRIAAGFYASAVLISYVASAYRLRPADEVRAADRGVMLMTVMIGVMLLVADGIRTRAHIRTVLKAITSGGTLLASLGIVQFFTGEDYAARIKVPGMTFLASDYAASRSGFSRIVGTVTHPIELSVVLVFVLVVALHLAFTEPVGERRPYIVAAIVIGVAVPMTVSRTAVIGLVAAAVVLFPGWDRVRKANMAAIALIGVVAMRLLVPGLIGTLIAFFTNSSNDPSRRSRGLGFDYVLPLIAQRPFFGRGLSTYIPANYFFLDDQILLTVVEIGFVGLVAVLLLFMVAAGQTRDVRRWATRSDDRELAQVLLAGIVVGFASAFTYDEFSFPTGLALLMIFFGLSGALWRIVRAERTRPAPAPEALRPVVPSHPDLARTGR